MEYIILLGVILSIINKISKLTKQNQDRHESIPMSINRKEEAINAFFGYDDALQNQNEKRLPKPIPSEESRISPFFGYADVLLKSNKEQEIYMLEQNKVKEKNVSEVTQEEEQLTREVEKQGAIFEEKELKVSNDVNALYKLFTDKNSIRTGIIMHEVLGPPKALADE